MTMFLKSAGLWVAIENGVERFTYNIIKNGNEFAFCSIIVMLNYDYIALETVASQYTDLMTVI